MATAYSDIPYLAMQAGEYSSFAVGSPSPTQKVSEDNLYQLQ